MDWRGAVDRRARRRPALAGADARDRRALRCGGRAARFVRPTQQVFVSDADRPGRTDGESAGGCAGDCIGHCRGHRRHRFTMAAQAAARGMDQSGSRSHHARRGVRGLRGGVALAGHAERRTSAEHRALTRARGLRARLLRVRPCALLPQPHHPCQAGAGRAADDRAV